MSSDFDTVLEAAIVEGRYDRDFGLNRHVMARAYFDDGYSRTNTPAEEGAISKVKLDVGRFGLEARHLWDTSPSNRIVFGAEFQRNYRVSYETEIVDVVTVFSGDFPVNVLSAYIQDEYQLRSNLAITAGLRADAHSTDVSDVNPRFAVIYHPIRSSTLKLLYGEAFRAPTTIEREFESAPTIERNPDIEPEKIQTFEFVWLQNIGTYITTNLSLYHYKMDDLIELTVDLEALTAQYINVLEVNATGVDTGVRVRLANGIQGYLQYSHQNAKDGVTELRLTNSPEHLVKIGAAVPVVKRVTVSAESIYESSRLTLERNETEPFFLMNASVLAKLPIASAGTVRLTVKNLLNNDYTIPSGFEIPIPQEGRDVTFRVSLAF